MGFVELSGLETCVAGEAAWVLCWRRGSKVASWRAVAAFGVKAHE
jgi:hypothetical protein